MKECSLCGRCLTDGHAVCPDDRGPLRPVFAGPPLLEGKYRLIRRLGAGGMGTVYRAHHLGLGRAVAVKVLPPGRDGEREAIERFRLEALALARLDHPSIVRITDFGFDEARATPYLVMELLAARSLDERLRRAGPLPLAAALPILDQIASALDYAHAAGILHRDLKASNVLLLERSGGGPAAKIIDFGLASFLADPEATPTLAVEHPAPDPGAGEVGAPVPAAPGLTASGMPSGTPGCMAPELWRGRLPSRASDLWAFGVLTFFTLTGRPPFPGPGTEALREQIARGAPHPSALHPDLDPELDAAILAPLRADPAARPARAREAVGELARALLRVRRWRWRRREAPRRLALAALLASLGLLALAPLSRRLAPLENRLVDARFHLVSPRLPRREPLLLLFDDAALASDPAPLATKAGEVGTLLERVFGAGARGVGIDLLLPQTWGASPEFSDLVLRHADSLVLAAASPAGRPVVGPEAVRGLTAAALGPARSQALFGFVDVEEDGDGVVRRARPLFRDTAGQVRSSFAARAARLLAPAAASAGGAGDEVWIDGTVDWRGYERLSWRDLANALERSPERFRDRFVLLGADYAASGDVYRIPHPGELPALLPGVTLQALILQTLLDGAPIRQPERAPLVAGLALALAAVAAAVLLGRRSIAVAGPVAAAAAWVAIAFALFATRRLLMPVAAPVAVLLLVAILAASLRLRRPSYPQGL
jgi:serine/threonine protein kinase